MAIWTIRTHYKKSCEQREFFYQREGDGKIISTDGFRRCEYTIETTDDEFPDIQFEEMPNGDGKKDSINLNSLMGDNIDNVELVEMFDGGCWGDIEFEGLAEDEEEKLREFIDEEGLYSLEDEGNWYLSDTEVWVWGPLEVEDENGNVRIIIADADGNVIDFVEEE
jgi:hypothetical protein